MRAVFLFDIQPVSKARPRLSKSGVYTPQKTKCFEKSIQLLARQQYRKAPIEGAISVTVLFNIPRPKSVTEKKRKYPCVKPDIDNYAKALLDALNGIAFKDDAQIIDLTLSKRYGEPGIAVEVEEVWES